MKRKSLPRAKLALCIIACAASNLDARANTPATPTRPLVVRQVPKALSSTAAPRLGDLSATRQLQLTISLPLRNEAQLDALLKQLYDPHSPQYRRYLAPEQFTERFGPTQRDYDKVAAWARDNDFEIRHTTPSRRVLSITGTVETINRALHVQMGTYQHPTEKRTFYAPDREPTLDLDVSIYSIAGLTDFSPPRPTSARRSPERQPKVFKGGSGPINGTYTPGDIRKAYVGESPLTGKGQTVGIVSFIPYAPKDLATYYENAGITSFPPVTIVPVGDVHCAIPCGDEEPVADIGNVAGVAPGLKEIIFYLGGEPAALLDHIATVNKAQIISSSMPIGNWGPNVGLSVYKQFAAQGQTFTQASGDGGAYPGDEVPPILNPYVLNVGGTMLTTDNQGAWQSEVAWPGSGGGFDAPPSPNSYSIPDYQKLEGVITSANGGSTQYRNGPDVAAEASNDFSVANGKVMAFAGTSVAAPRWAAFLALVNEARQSNGQPPVGFINPTLYALGLSTNYRSSLHDITQGNNSHDKNPGYYAVPGYDLVTGWGTPATAFFVAPPLPSISKPGKRQRYWFNDPITAAGNGISGATIRVTIDDRPFCSTQVQPDTSWSCSASPFILPGNYTLSVHQAMGLMPSPPAQVSFSIVPCCETR